ncbi:hypothetical protein G5C51_38435 [Streptomyces sp. A7024]|uniref:Uncharacterized protein n=1 Tax=Streptomyces coryli TaxID=1128680 RepID=A0A6G4UC52_9ACTN|nr:hypothetical protein [Streptomyces coryli]NGN69754.1 hypothetical protein [Streptomyces coryli]
MPASAPQTLPAAKVRQLAIFAVAVCVLAVAAAVVSFVQGYWLGVLWLLLAGLASNMAWYYVRRTRAARRLEEARRRAA